MIALESASIGGTTRAVRPTSESGVDWKRNQIESMNAGVIEKGIKATQEYTPQQAEG